ncbi:MAG TPA: hypothetical protein VNA69_11065 [Thermoanaerobaculia bacterium]|nr:hypothetical protein [Thermoanaerobaculia bacterium]
MTAIETTAVSLDLSILLGDWRNTNAEGGIARIVCRGGEPGEMVVQAYGRTADGMNDWGAVAAPVFAFTFESKQAGAFNAVFDLGYEEVHMQANVKAGVLVVASFNHFKDRSGRSNYFDREFFHRIGGA